MLPARAYTTATRLGMTALMATAGGAATRIFVAGNSISWGKLNFQLDDLIPLLIRAITLGNRKQLTQTTSAVVLGLGNNHLGLIFWRVFGNWIVHLKLMKAGLVHHEPRMD